MIMARAPSIAPTLLIESRPRARPARVSHVDHTTVHGATPQLPLWNPRL